MTLTSKGGALNPHRYNTSRRAKAKLDDIVQVKRWIGLGLSNTEIASKLKAQRGVSLSTAAICDIRKGRNWGWVTP